MIQCAIQSLLPPSNRMPSLNQKEAGDMLVHNQSLASFKITDFLQFIFLCSINIDLKGSKFYSYPIAKLDYQLISQKAN